MALTGLQAITNSMYHLGVLKAGGTPSTDQQTAFLALLNQMLEGFQAAQMLGFTRTTAISGKSEAIAVSTAGVVTETNTGGTTTTVNTPVVVATYASVGTSNTYPVGWEEMIEWNLAVMIAGAQGAAIPEHVLARAAETKAACTPKSIQQVASAT